MWREGCGERDVKKEGEKEKWRKRKVEKKDCEERRMKVGNESGE